ncbi:MAG: type II secretion system protein [Candidatus Pacebacteria bacterium]|nr:type II secretion system protein [Candidatus Paceibacterota bacterium]
MKNKFKNLEIEKKGFTPSTFAKKVGGFTLVETLVGISILLVAIAGPLTIAYQGVSLSLNARDQIVASLLAQEGIEFVRFRIGTNNNMGSVGSHLVATTTPPGLAYSLSNCLDPGECTINVFLDVVAPCGGTCPYLKYDSGTGKYNYTSGDNTFFRRSIRIDHAGAVDDVEFQVESKVEWGRPNDVRSIVLKEVIMDWQP